MKRKKKRRYKKNPLISKRVTMFIIIIAIIIFIYNVSTNENEETASVNAFSSINEIVDEIETGTYANINRYIVYGTHFNIEGDMDISEINPIESAKVVAKTASGKEISIDTEYTHEDDQLSFSTLMEINTGLDLESLNVEDYYILLKVEFSNSETKYYSLTNDTGYGNIEYYTLTRNNKNNRINIDFTTINHMPILGFHITTVNELPEDVYDVVIDPGHGGSDVGAINGRYMESEIALDCALELKEQLEAIGLKVLLTRDGTESEEEYTMYNIYDEDGRVTMANESHSKVLISLHLNSNFSDNVDGGVEIYASSNSDLTFAKKLADGSLTVGGAIDAYANNGSIAVTINTTADSIKLKSENLNIITDGKALMTANNYDFSAKGYIGGLKTTENSTVDEQIICAMETYKLLNNPSSHTNMNISGGTISNVATEAFAYIASNGDLKVTGANANKLYLTAPDKFIEITGSGVHADTITIGNETDKLKVDFASRDYTLKYTNIRDAKEVTINGNDEITYELTNGENGYNVSENRQEDTTYLVGPEKPVDPEEPTIDPEDNENAKVLRSYEKHNVDMSQVYTPVAYAADLDDDTVDRGVRKNVDGSVTVVKAFPMGK